MKLQKLVFIAALTAASFNACADAGGKFIVEGKEFALVSAYAYTHPHPFDDSKPSTVIAFSGRAFDEKAIATSDDPVSALSTALNSYVPGEERPARVEIIFSRDDKESPIVDISYAIPALSSQASARAANYTIQFERNDDQRIEGSLRSNQESAKTAKYGGGYFDLHFALDVHPDAGD